jgi:tetratricopeptide (TPR) repeat protein
LLFAEGDFGTLRALTDSLVRAGGEAKRRNGLPWARTLALLDGRWRDYVMVTKERLAVGPAPEPAFAIRQIRFEAALKGPSPAAAVRLDSAIALVQFNDLPMVDRPYLEAAGTLARIGNAAKARALLARYRAEVTDTSLRRVQVNGVHYLLAEIALAEGKPQDAITEFRQSDVGFDGAPADECAPCLSLDLGRAFDAARVPDSAAFYFERYLATPFWNKWSLDMDPLRLPVIRERLGQLYESMGNTDKALENYRAFAELWKNADPDLQPRVADARKRIARLTPVEKPRP